MDRWMTGREDVAAEIAAETQSEMACGNELRKKSKCVDERIPSGGRCGETQDWFLPFSWRADEM